MVDLDMYRCSIGSFFVTFNMRFYCSKRSKQSCDKIEIFKTIWLITMVIIGILALKGLAFIKTFFMEEQLRSVTYNAAILPKLLVNIHAMCLPTLIFAFKRVVDHNFEARYKFGNKKVAGIRLLHWNKGSSYLENKMNEIATIIDKYKPHVFGISEANFLHDHHSSNVEIPEYKIHFCPTLQNPSLKASRIIVYTHESLIVKPRHDLMDENVSAIWMEVGLPHKKKFLVGQVYREWGHLNQSDRDSHRIGAQLDRWKILLRNWEKALNEDKEVIVQGDMNLNSLKWMREDLPSNDHTQRLRPLIDLLFENIIPLGVSQLINVPTHNNSCLDHLYTNRPEKMHESAAIVNGGSDHKIILAVRKAHNLVKRVRYIKRRCYKNFDVESFRGEIHALKWFDIYMSDDVNSAVTLLAEKIVPVLDRYAPLKTIQVRVKYAPWLSEETKTAIQHRNRAQQSLRTCKDQNKSRQYKNLRNKVTNMLRRDKKLWEQSKLNHMINNSANLWKSIKGMMAWKSNGPPQQLFYRGKLLNSPKALALTMNEFFLEKISNLQARLPPTVGDPLVHLKRMMSDRKCSFQFKVVHPDEVMKIVTGLNNTKSSGLDEIDVFTVKLIIDDILPALTHIVNLSLSTSTFPMKWKTSKVIPLFKKGDPLNPKNYRPVALLPILSKVLEKIVFNQVVEYIERNKILHPSHHGSRANFNTSTAVIEMQSYWIDAMERGEVTGVMMLDLSAAFDLVDHRLLLQKLDLMGFDETALNWVSSYLSDRWQCVYVDGQTSDLKQLSVGVPQGSC